MPSKRKSIQQQKMPIKRGKYKTNLESGTSPSRSTTYDQDKHNISDSNDLDDKKEFYNIINPLMESLQKTHGTRSKYLTPRIITKDRNNTTPNEEKLLEIIQEIDIKYRLDENSSVQNSMDDSLSDFESNEDLVSEDNAVEEFAETLHGSYEDSCDLEDDEFWSTGISGDDSYLRDKLSNGDLDKPNNTRFVVTEVEMLYAMQKYTEKYSLPISALEDLCKMQNSFVNSPVVRETRYRLDGLLRSKNGLEYYAVCLTCNIYLRRFYPNERSILCKKCKKTVTLRGNEGNFFVILNIEEEVKYLVEKHGEYYMARINNRDQSNVFRDIYDGIKYKQFVESLSESERNSFLTCTVNSDGSAAFKHSTYSIWPIQVLLNELPQQVRFDHPVTCALWFGRSKPIMNIFLKMFAKKINNINSKTIPCEVNGVLKNLKLYPICCCADSVARAPMQGLIQFNGRFGCNWCYHPGKLVKSKKKKVIKYPLLDIVPEKRTSAQMLEHMEKKLGITTPVFGVKKTSALVHLPYFDVVEGFVPDVMHNSFLGICPQFARYWFEESGNAFYIKKEISSIDAILNNIKVPKQIARLTRPIKDRKHWKSRDWENFLLFFSLPILESIPGFEKYAQHWALFVEAIHILLSKCIIIKDVKRAEKLLKEFVAKTEEYYGETAMTFNIHQLLHLVQSVINWGPLWAHSGYAFESGNGKIVRMVKAANGVLNQICRRIEYKNSTIRLEKHILTNYEDSPVIEFVYKLENRCTLKSVAIVENRYFGKSNFTDEFTIQRLNLTLGNTRFYNKMVKNNCLFTTSAMNTTRSKNCFALTKNKNFIQMIQIIVDDIKKKELVVYNDVTTKAAFKECSSIVKITNIAKEEKLIEINNIACIAVCIDMPSGQYISPVPNELHY